MSETVKTDQPWPRRISTMPTFSPQTFEESRELLKRWHVVRLPRLVNVFETYGWIVNVLHGRWASYKDSYTGERVFCFEELNDAVYFKLRWFNGAV